MIVVHHACRRCRVLSSPPASESKHFSLRGRAPAVQWACLCVGTLGCVGLLLLARLSAALLLGSMIAAIAVAWAEGTLKGPERAYRLAQGVIGCLIAPSLNAWILHEMVAHWPVFLFSVLSVIVVSTSLGGLLARF